MKLFIEELAIILQALKGENGRDKQKHFQAGLAIHGHTKQAIVYRDEHMAADVQMQNRTALIEKIETWQVQVEIGQKGGKK